MCVCVCNCVCMRYVGEFRTTDVHFPAKKVELGFEMEFSK